MFDNPASWIWVLIPLAAIGIAPFKMWLRVKEKQIEAQSSLAAEKTAQYAAHVERIEDAASCARADCDRPRRRHRSADRGASRQTPVEIGEKVQ